MKFYYNGELIRTSKNHEYTHAVIDVRNNGCYGCRTSAKAAQAIIDTHIRNCDEEINNCMVAVKALKAGKSGYIAQVGRNKYPHIFAKDDTVESYMEWIEDRIARKHELQDNLIVVELEQR